MERRISGSQLLTFPPLHSLAQHGRVAQAWTLAAAGPRCVTKLDRHTAEHETAEIFGARQRLRSQALGHTPVLR